MSASMLCSPLHVPFRKCQPKSPILWMGLLRTRSSKTKQVRQLLKMSHKCRIVPAGCWTRSWMRRQMRAGLLAGRGLQWAC